MPYTVIWYGKKGELARLPFDDEKSAKTHVTSMLPIKIVSDGVVAVEVRKADGAVVYSHAGSAS
ncbi:MAG: hypothetical protein ABIQ51_17920 [Mesorhizobium sp.]